MLIAICTFFSKNCRKFTVAFNKRTLLNKGVIIDFNSFLQVQEKFFIQFFLNLSFRKVFRIDQCKFGIVLFLIDHQIGVDKTCACIFQLKFLRLVEEFKLI